MDNRKITVEGNFRMRLYAVAMRDYSVAFIEFYWAENPDHAMEQAVNSHPTSRHICVAIVPCEYTIFCATRLTFPMPT